MDFISIFTDNPLRGALGALLLAGLGYLLKLSFTQRQLQREAGQRIIDAFRPELDALIQQSGDAGLVLNDAAFEKHEAAIRNNKNDLSWYARVRLRFAWDQLAYYKQDKAKYYPSYNQYFDGGSSTKRRVFRTLAISRIQKIVSIVK